ncbi:2,3-bisphosphoglycerate-independent phosphoglycerate mutase [Bacteroidota bacterium]
MKNKKVLLMILDGWGIGDKSEADAIYNANTPYIDSLMEKFPHSQLSASGMYVGLPDGQMGNSEVGHLNIGAGRIVNQDLVKINLAIKDGSIAKEKVLINAYEYAKENNKNVHLIGLLSDGGVHSLHKHLYKLCDIAKEQGLEKVYIHALMDGRDTDPRSGYGFLSDLMDFTSNSPCSIASVSGRYYAMDRDKRWKRVKKGYDLLVKGKGKKTTDVLKAVRESYDEGVTDEFIKPIIVVDDEGKPLTKVRDGDVFICFNFRTDRLREITYALTQKDMPEHGMKTKNLYYVTITRYDDTFKNMHIIFDREHVHNTIGEYLSKNKKRQLRAAETEKYAHVTFFFSGGREQEFKRENRILINSPGVATYDLQPEMSAYQLKDALLPELEKQKHDFIVLNFANGDMVGHTGVYPAILKAVETVDNCVREVVEKAKQNGYTVMIIADHGNADHAKNADGSPNTAHSLNPVPCILVSDDYTEIKDGILADVAPTILNIMGLEIPIEMTGNVLV